MGYNRSGTRRSARLRRAKREQERLAKKGTPAAQSGQAAAQAGRAQQATSAGEVK
jgi:hypothetical protein